MNIDKQAVIEKVIAEYEEIFLHAKDALNEEEIYDISFEALAIVFRAIGHFDLLERVRKLEWVAEAAKPFYWCLGDVMRDRAHINLAKALGECFSKEELAQAHDALAALDERG